MDKQELKQRTKDIGLRIMKLVDALPTKPQKTEANEQIRNQKSKV